VSRIRSLILVGLLASTTLVVTPGPASAGIPGCSLSALKPGGSGTTARARFKITCFVAAPFQYQVALWERDDGPDQKLSQTAWTTAVIPDTFTYAGKGPLVSCQTEAGKEELYTKVRARVGAPGAYETTPWKTSAAVTTRTCQ
jgi:hypothetical protein